MARSKSSSSREFNKRLQRLIEASGMNLSTIARKSTIPVTTLQQWTVQTLPTDYAAVKRLAQVLVVSFSYLLTGEDDGVSAMKPSIEDVFGDGGEVFNGYLEVQIKRLIPKKKDW